MLLALDIGNTQTVIGLYESAGSPRLATTWRIKTTKAAAVDDIRSKILPLFTLGGIEVPRVDEAILASVVPALTTAWTEVIESIWSVQPIICSAKVAHEAGLFDADYANPSEIGADRVADAVAARARFGAPVIVVDFGTATNIEAIDRTGAFVGGVIAPGLRTGADALFAHATKLAATELAAPERTIGRNTEEAIQSGLIFGEAWRADALIASMLSELGEQPQSEGGSCAVVATGGFAELLSRYSSVITDVDPNLTLEGLRLIASTTKGESPC